MTARTHAARIPGRLLVSAALGAALVAALSGRPFASAQEAPRTSRASGPPGAEFDTDAVKSLAAAAEKLTLDEQIALLRRVRHALSERLLTPAAHSWEDWGDFRDRTDAGVARILNRGIVDDSLVPARGGGCYWSFTRRSHSYDEHPQVEYQQGRFSSGFYGGACGIVAAVDGVTLREVTESSVPSPFAAAIDEVRKADRGRNWSPSAKVGSVYVVRTASIDEFDVLAAFQVVEIDDLGATIAWRVVRTYDVPRREPR